MSLSFQQAIAVPQKKRHLGALFYLVQDRVEQVEDHILNLQNHGLYHLLNRNTRRASQQLSK